MNSSSNTELVTHRYPDINLTMTKMEISQLSNVRLVLEVVSVKQCAINSLQLVSQVGRCPLYKADIPCEFL